MWVQILCAVYAHNDGSGDEAVTTTAGRRNGRGSHFVQSVARVLAVIESFSEHRRSQTLSEVARETGLDRATVRRLLLTLVDLGFVATDGRLFELTPRVLQLGYAYLSSMSLPEFAQPHLRALAAELNETAAVAVLDGDDVVYAALVPSARLTAVRISIGTRLPAYGTSMGRVLLAGKTDAELDDYLNRVRLEVKTSRSVRTPEKLRKEIDQVRVQGWAMVDAELEEELCGAAAPVRDRAGRVVAAANVSVHAARATTQLVRRTYVPAILRTVRLIEADIHGSALR